MTREEAINILKANVMVACDTSDKVGYGTPLNKAIEQALNMSIKALEQEPCEDCVSRKAVIETIDDCNSDGLKGIFCSYDDGERFKKYIKNLPPVTPTKCIATVKFSKEDMQELVDEKMKDIVAERKKGHWEQYGDSWKEKYRCSECKEEQPKMLCGEQIIGIWSDYCPNCGADMRGEDGN